jgi:hypothetical protein
VSIVLDTLFWRHLNPYPQKYIGRFVVGSDKVVPNIWYTESVHESNRWFGILLFPR